MPLRNTLLPVALILSAQLAVADNLTDLLKMPQGSNLIKTVHAKGVQVYQCSQTLGPQVPGAYEWKWQAPEAILFDDDQKTEAGSHGAGPTWKYKDGSSIKAKMVQQIDSPDTNAVPWLLLATTEHNGVGVLSGTQFILRFNTQGGLAPTTGCDTNHLGSETKVPYHADYSFYGQ